MGKGQSSSMADIAMDRRMRGVLIRWDSGEGIAWEINQKLLGEPMALIFSGMGLV